MHLKVHYIRVAAADMPLYLGQPASPLLLWDVLRPRAFIK